MIVVDELKQLINVWHRFKQSIIDDAVDEQRKCLCIRVNLCERKTFRAFNSTPIMHMLFAHLVC